MKRVGAPPQWRETLAAALRAFDHTSAEDCDRCLVWELRYLVAVRVAYYLTIHIRDPRLRETVIAHVATAWVLCVSNSSHRAGFERFFADYCTDVERNLDPTLQNTARHAAEFRRVWTNHALTLGRRHDRAKAQAG